MNELLAKKYPYKIYGKEVKEGFETPSFFAEILDKGSRIETRNFAGGGFTVKIIYFQSEKNEKDQLEKADQIKELFGMVFRVGNRCLTVGEYSYGFIGEYSDILQINIDIDYKENISKDDTVETAETIETRIVQG